MFDRETFKLEDGGTVGIDWAFDRDAKVGRPQRTSTKSKPIIIMFPGLGGDNDNIYTTYLQRKARSSGFKVGIGIFRGSAGLPITSGKLNYSGAWQDCKAILEYVHSKYVSDEKCERLYAYGISLGANILALYMVKEGANASKTIDGAALYGTPWSAKKGGDYFFNHTFGLYNKVFGLHVNETIRKKQLPAMKPYVSEEDYAFYKKALEGNWQGMQVLDSKVYPRMFGHANNEAYCNYVTIAERACEIKVPTFALGAEDD